MPAGLGARAWERWAPLISIADAAGGPGQPWKSRARHAAKALEKADYQMSESETLLSDVRACLSNGLAEREFLAGKVLVEHLVKLDRWQSMESGKPLTTHKLTGVLGEYGVPKERTSGQRGFAKAALVVAFDRYLGA